ncbi:head-tail connector protein [Lactococcus garvieae]|uniref:head-tail connector protein n=1 Tax=Lactococcus garvieae TaxID=1363 RepID=UPI0018D932B3|nr:head-tail connector protein [Lactococcus garvieae]QPR48981.1 phage gp6-like head-tail connector protein [Lactococcus garvieae]
MRVDLDNDDDLILSYIEAAASFVTNAITEHQDEIDFFSLPTVKPLYETAVLALSGAYYTYRVALVDVQHFNVDLVLNSIIGQLRGKFDCYKYGDGDE